MYGWHHTSTQRSLVPVTWTTFPPLLCSCENCRGRPGALEGLSAMASSSHPIQLLGTSSCCSATT